MQPARGSRASRVGSCQHPLGGEGEWDSPHLVIGMSKLDPKHNEHKTKSPWDFSVLCIRSLVP